MILEKKNLQPRIDVAEEIILGDEILSVEPCPPDVANGDTREVVSERVQYAVDMAVIDFDLLLLQGLR